VDLAKQNGYNEEMLNLLKNSTKPLLAPIDIRKLYLRQLIDSDFHDFLLAQYGYTKKEIEQLKTLYYDIPSAQDLIRFAVREAFSPSVIAAFGLHEEFPEDFRVNAEKIGLSEEWAKAFWASHWILPSIQMGYEMLHRGVIDNDTLDLLLKTQDIMPYWRDKLKAISYAPYTRVDVRRMYQAGVLDEADVYQSYLDIGYNNDKAQKMTEFTIANTQNEERELTKNEILVAYKKGIITKNEAIEYLKTLNYSDYAIDVIITSAELKRAKEAKELCTSQVKQLYTKGIIEKNEVLNRLSTLGYQSTEISLLLEQWDSAVETKAKRLTPEKLESLYKVNIISKKEYQRELKYLGYATKYVNWLVQLSDLKKVS
jgi:uncharacterized protein YqgQ